MVAVKIKQIYLHHISGSTLRVERSFPTPTSETLMQAILKFSTRAYIVPLRAISEAVEAEIQWETSTQSITIILNKP